MIKRHPSTNAILVVRKPDPETGRPTIHEPCAGLEGADLTGARLAWADLTGARLTGARLAWADLTGANLTEVNLAEANLAEARLAGANLAEANLAGVDHRHEQRVTIGGSKYAARHNLR